MERKVFDREEAEAELNKWKEKINQLRAQIEHSKEEIKIDVLGDLEKLENQEAKIKNKLIQLNEGKNQWEDIEASIGDALFEIKWTYEKANSKHDL